jgi:hypothetical protein
MEKEIKKGQGFIPGNKQLYDQLEAAPERRQSCEITYLDDQNEQWEVVGLINDLYTDQEVRYVRLHSQQVIRLDRIIRLKQQDTTEQAGL